jgi:hypothetical protein
VTGSVQLEHAAAGPPDAGTAAGHGADAAVGYTKGRFFVLRGTVRPADAAVQVLEPAYRGLSAVPRRDGAGFTVRLGPLRAGVNRFVVEATKRDHRPWRLEVRIVRQAPAAAMPRAATVAAVDRTPPEAATLRLDRERLVATASGRDGEGMGRIRVSAELRIACRDGRERELVVHVPPPMVETVKVTAGTRVPTRLRRRVSLARVAARRCGGGVRSVAGRAWAEATNAHGRDRYSAYVPIG